MDINDFSKLAITMAVGTTPLPKLSLIVPPYPPNPPTFQSSTSVSNELSLICKGNFVVIRPIGQGSMGSVYLIKSEKNREEGENCFAMKEMDCGLEHDPDAIKKKTMIQREIRILSHLSHPNIVHYYASMISSDSRHVQIVQEFCNKGTLFRAIRDRRVAKEDFYDENEVLTWSIQLASALSYLHECKILHRDLKSHNIFLSSVNTESAISPLNTSIKVGDFGISRPLEGTNDLASTCVGTPAYMAPEVCHKNPYSYPCDVWSLGCVMVEICSLKPAFQSTGLVSMVFKILNADFTQLPDSYSQTLVSLIHSLFHTEPEIRPTAKQILIFLNQMLQDCSSAKSNTVDDYENDFDSFSDNSAHNLEISQETATLSVIFEGKNNENLTPQTGPIHSNTCEISHISSSNQTLVNETSEFNYCSFQNGENYSDDFESLSESGED